MLGAPMRIDRDAFLLLTAALAACHAQHADATHASAVPKASTAPAAIDPAKLCDELATANLAEADRAAGHCEGGQPGSYQLTGDVPTAHAAALYAAADGSFPCMSGSGGAWGMAASHFAISAPATESGPQCGWEAQVRVLYRSARGERFELPLHPRVDFGDPGELDFRGLFDFDGDGRSEALVMERPGGYGSCGPKSRLLLLQATATGIRDYPVGQSFTATVDADGDGRPDLVDDHYYASADPYGGLCGDATLYGPPLLLHSLPDGTFSLDDAVTRGWARAQCPTKPADPLENVPCARIWGATEAEIVDAATRASAGVPPQDVEYSLAIVRGFAVIAPPFKPLSIDTPPPLPKPKPKTP